MKFLSLASPGFADVLYLEEVDLWGREILDHVGDHRGRLAYPCASRPGCPVCHLGDRLDDHPVCRPGGRLVFGLFEVHVDPDDHHGDHEDRQSVAAADTVSEVDLS